MGSAMSLRVSRGAAIVTWMLAVGYVVMKSLEGEGGMREVVFEAWGVAVARFLVMGWVLAAVGQMVAWIVAGRDAEGVARRRQLSLQCGAIRLAGAQSGGD